jgi:putative transposase
MTSFDPQRHHRRSIRLKGYDYSQAGAYFVTICTQGRICLLGDVVNDQMELNNAGRLMESVWLDLPNRFSTVELDEFVVMPSHMHGIIVIVDRPIHNLEGSHVPTQNETTTYEATTRVAPTAADDVGAGLVLAHDAITHRVTTRVTPTTTGNARAGTRPAPNEVTHGTTTRVTPTKLDDIVGAYKSIATDEYIVGVKQWGWPRFDRKLLQRNYYEHISRNERELNAIRQYICDNPLRWALDLDNPANWKRGALNDTADVVYLYLREAGL